jgi:hypothetical protein
LGRCAVPTIAMAFPLPRDKVDTWLRGMAEISGPRRAEFDAARRRQGVTGTKVWLQEGPGGPVEILVMETEDPDRAFADMGASQEPFDVWFRALILDVYGLDLSQPLPSPGPRQILDWSARVPV